MENYRPRGNSPSCILLKYIMFVACPGCPASEYQVLIPVQGYQQYISKDTDGQYLTDPNRSHGHKDQVL